MGAAARRGGSGPLDNLTFCVRIVSVPHSRLEQVLDAAYACFIRYGIRRTTMDDIAVEAGMSRPAVYQYVRNKNEAYRLVAERMFGQAIEQARSALARPGPLADRVYDIVAVKLELTLRLVQDSPHAAELLGATGLISDLSDQFTEALVDLLASALTDAGIESARELAEVLLALTRGLEADLTDPDIPRRRLRYAVSLLIDASKTNEE